MAAPNKPMAPGQLMQTLLRPEPVICPATAILPVSSGREKQIQTLISNGPGSYPDGPLQPGARERVGERVDQRGHARPPARGDVVVQAEGVVVPHGRYDRPAGPRGDHRRGLAAVGGLVVLQEDELRPGGDNVPPRQLRVAAVGGPAGGGGDVRRPEAVQDVP